MTRTRHKSPSEFNTVRLNDPKIRSKCKMNASASNIKATKRYHITFYQEFLENSRISNPLKLSKSMRIIHLQYDQKTIPTQEWKSNEQENHEAKEREQNKQEGRNYLRDNS